MSIIKINQNTAKKELLDNLAKISNINRDLIIKIETLPNFLTTPIAFTIFSYQISSYPRRIFWDTEDSDILQILLSCGALIFNKSNDFDDAFKQKVQQKEEITKINSQINNENKKIGEENIFENNSFFNNHIFDNIQNNNLLTFENDRSIKNLLMQTAEEQKKITLEINNDSNFLKNNENKDNNSSINYFDNWLDRIENTRKAIDNIQKKQIIRRNKHFKNILIYTFSSILVLFVSILGIINFPTQVYSLEISPSVQKRVSYIEVLKTDFLTTTENIINEENTIPNQSEIISVERSVGKVTLINNSISPIAFTKAGIILIANDGREYTHLAKPEEPNTIVVPGQSNLDNKNITIDVISSQKGSNYNLPNGTNLRIFNLKKDLIGGSFFGIVTEEINNNKNTDNKIVTEDDIKNLEAINNKNIQQKAVDIITKKSLEKDIYIKNNWYQIVNIENNFSNKIGEISKNLIINSKAKVDIFYLNKDLLETKLKEKNMEINKILEINNIESDTIGIFDKEKIGLEVSYSYIFKQEVDTGKVKETLNKNDLDLAKKELQKQYPDIVNIEKTKSGFDIPWISPKTDINVEYRDE